MPLKRRFPLRLIIPKLLAYKSPKYVESIEFTYQVIERLWVACGYPSNGIVRSGRLRKGNY